MRIRFTNLILFVLFVGFGWLLGKIQTSYRNSGEVDPFSEFIQVINQPVVTGVTSFSDWVADFLFGVTHANYLLQKNLQINENLKLTQQEVQKLKSLESENENLKRLIGIKNVYLQKQKIPAKVIGYFPYENRMNLSAGSNQGVESGMPVISGDGIIGVIQNVAADSSQVNLITSSTLKIGGLIQKEIPIAGLIRGNSGNTLLFEFMDEKAPVQISDQVVTSGFSERIPRGIPIGKIIQIENNADFGTRRFLVYPSVQLSMVREAYILK